MTKTCDDCAYLNLGLNEDPCNKCNTEYSEWVDATKSGRIIVNSGNNPVNHPFHYNKGKIEVWDFISDQGLNFDRGNAIKYICRAGTKDPDKEIQDLKKAIEYINHEIKMLKGETDNGTEKET